MPRQSSKGPALKTPAVKRAPKKTPKTPVAIPKVTRAATILALMREDNGATAQTLADAVGWQLHSVRGFISGTLKKRADLAVTTTRIDGVARYAVRDCEAVGA